MGIINHIILCEEDIEKMGQIKVFILSNLNKKLDISLLCSRFDIGNSTLRRQFAICYGQSVSAYILTCRMARAMELITAKHTSIKKIANLVGYKRRTTFTHAFTKYYGHPPAFYKPMSELSVLQSGFSSF